MRVKICGITNNEDAQVAVNAGADALGFVFAKSPRQVTKELARGIIQRLPPFVSPVAVFADEQVDAIKEICGFCGIHTVQLHGNEPPEYVNYLGRYRVIKAFRVRGEEDIQQLAHYKPHAFLLDSYVKGIMGGTGTIFNWELAKQAHKYGPLILSGGLTPGNVSEAIRVVNPYAVDVSSGVEISPGRKDKELVRWFIMNAKLGNRKL